MSQLEELQMRYLYLLILRVSLSYLKDCVENYIPNEIHINDTHRENCALLNSVQEFIEKDAWLLLTFFPCLHN